MLSSEGLNIELMRLQCKLKLFLDELPKSIHEYMLKLLLTFSAVVKLIQISATVIKLNTFQVTVAINDEEIESFTSLVGVVFKARTYKQK